jgi:hypothetical protein
MSNFLNTIRDIPLLWVAAAAGAVTAVIVGLLAPDKFLAALARLRRWLPALAVLAAVVVFAWYLPRRYPPGQKFADRAVPRYFLHSYWYVVLVAGLGLVASGLWLRSVLRSLRSDWATGGPLDEAWAAVLGRVGLRGRRVQLLLAPDAEGEGRAEALLRAADLRVDAEAPAGPSPLHARAVPDGVVLSCEGAWDGGLHGEGPARAEDLGRKLRAAGSGRPAVAGLAVVFPLDWAAAPGAVDQAAVAWEEIQTFYRTLGVRCPVLALFPGLEGLPGMPVFARRLAELDPLKTEKRVGFEVPDGRPFDAALARDALDWLASWVHANVLDVLKARPGDYRDNLEIVLFDSEFRARRRLLARVLDVAFSSHGQGDEPVSVRGAYFTAAEGPGGVNAFALGLFHGSRHPLLPGRPAAGRWTRQAARDDARDRRLAWALAALVVPPAALAWWSIREGEGWPTLLGWAGLVALGLGWAAALLAPVRRVVGGTDGDLNPAD